MLRFSQYLVILLVVAVSGCTVHFKGKDIELDTKPATPTLAQSNHTYELDKIAVFK